MMSTRRRLDLKAGNSVGAMLRIISRHKSCSSMGHTRVNSIFTVSRKWERLVDLQILVVYDVSSLVYIFKTAHYSRSPTSSLRGGEPMVLDLEMEVLENLEAPEIDNSTALRWAGAAFFGGVAVGLFIGGIVILT